MFADLAGRKYYIGLRDVLTEGQFIWDESETVGPSDQWPWSSGEPSDSQGYDNCVELDGIIFTWNDISCIEAKYGICELGISQSSKFSDVWWKI